MALFRTSISRLIIQISKELTDEEYETLKHFAFDYLKTASVEKIEKYPSRQHAILVEMTNHLNDEDFLHWLKNVCHRLKNVPMMKLILEYEVDNHNKIQPFTIMLHDVRREMENSDFEDLKLSYKGDIDQADLESVKNPYELFRLLKRLGRLKEDKLDDFKARLEVLNNKKMVNIVKEYEDTRAAHGSSPLCNTVPLFGRSRRVQVASQIMIPPPSVMELEQRHGVRFTEKQIAPGPEGGHWSVSTGIAELCTETPGLSLSSSRGQQQNTADTVARNEQVKELGIATRFLSSAFDQDILSSSGQQSAGTTAVGTPMQPIRPAYSEMATMPIYSAISNNPSLNRFYIGTEHPANIPQFDSLLSASSEVDEVSGNHQHGGVIPSLQSSDKCSKEKRCQQLLEDPDETNPKTAVTDESVTRVKLGCGTEASGVVETGTRKLYSDLPQCDTELDLDKTSIKMSVLDVRRPAPVSVGCDADRVTEASGVELHAAPGATIGRQAMAVEIGASKLHADSPWLNVEPDISSISLASRDGTVQSGDRDSTKSPCIDISPICGAENVQKENGDQEKNVVEVGKSLKQFEQPIKMYGYQEELAQPALEGLNCIVCAPTGSGKTLTAAYICYEKRQKALAAGEQFKALFIVRISNLVEQQKDEIMKMFSKDDDSSNIVAGINDTVQLEELMQDFDVVVLAAQILVNSLKNNEVHLNEFQLLIFDECHHIKHGHPYDVILQIYDKLKREGHKVPQVVGLAASLSVGDEVDLVDRYIDMCASFHCSCITHVTDPRNKRELLEHSPIPQCSQILGVERRNANDIFASIIIYLMTQVEAHIQHLSGVHSERGTQKYENWLVEMRAKAEDKHFEAGPFIYNQLHVLNNALMYSEELMAEDVLPLLKGNLDKSNHALPQTRIQQNVYELFRHYVQELEHAACNQRLEDNPKLTKLCQLLADLYLRNREAKGILLARTRFTVEGLVSFIRRHDFLKDWVKCDKFVGEGCGDGYLLNMDMKNLTRFKYDSSCSDHTNLLVAPYGAEEDLNIPRCSFVIHYNPLCDESDFLQSSVLARVKKSECYLIVDKDAVNEVSKILRKEHTAMEQLKTIDNQDLQRRIQVKQENSLHETKTEECQQHLFNVKQVTIHCKACKQFLCSGTDLRLGRSNCLVISSEFEERVMTKTKTFNKYSQVGRVPYAFCANQSCQCQLGPKIQYNSGRPSGYALSREAVVWRMDDQNEYRQIEQWSKVPFRIEEEACEDA